MLRRFLSRVATWRRDTTGTIAVVFALSLLPVLILAGLAIDVQRLYSVESQLQSASDAAALVGAKLQKLDPQNAAASARKYFDANVTFVNTAASPRTTISSFAFNVTATQVIITATADVPMAFMPLIGKSTQKVGAKSVANLQANVYYQIAFLADISNSMTIGGTQVDILALQLNSKIKCAFACHDPNNVQDKKISSWCRSFPLDYFCGGNPTYCPWGPWGCTYSPSPNADSRAIARSAGIKLKIDYVNDAMNSFMAKLKPKMDASPERYDVGIFTYGTYSGVLQDMTNSSSAVVAASRSVDAEVALPPMYGHNGFTDAGNGLTAAYRKLKNIGDGSSPAKRKTYLILIGDGLDDLPTNRTTGIFYNDECAALKKDGVLITSILTPYPVLINDGNYDALVKPHANNIEPAFRQCASSPADFYRATDGPAIQAAVDNTFDKLIGSIHLSN